MAKEKPGVMMYWETFDVLESLVDGDAKLMVSAIRQYAQYGALPDFNGNNLLSTLWILIRPKLDADSERYERIRRQKREAGLASAAKRVNARQQMLTGVNKCQRNQPTTDTTTDTEEGIMAHVDRDHGRSLTSPPQCSNIEKSDFEELRQQKIKELQSTFERR